MKLRLNIILIFTATQLSFAQQDAMFTHYMFNTLAINPAYAGSRDALTIMGLHRTQWVSFEGAPVTQTLTVHSPIPLKNAGLGLSVINDKIGPTNTTSIYLDFSYKIKVTKKSMLAFGIKGGINLFKNNLNELDLYDPIDPAFSQNIASDLLPNFGFGLYYYTDKYYVGLSIPKLLENNFATNSVSGSTNLGGEEKHYFLIAGYLINLNENFKIKPTTFIKVTKAAPVEADISALVYYKEKIWAGAMFRTGDALGMSAGVFVTPKLALGYSYDWSFTNTTFKYNGGSHEILLQYDFVFLSEQKIRSPRYF